MGFRRDGKAEHEEAKQWEAWKISNDELLKTSGLAASVLRSRADWDYLMRYGYHCDDGYPNIDYSLDEMTEPQRTAFRHLLEKVLTEEKKKHGNAGWHFVCPPNIDPK